MAKKVTNGQEASAEQSRRRATDAEIAQRAYEIYESRGSAPGGDLDDWLQAEREFNDTATAEIAQSKSAAV